jgi:cytosine/adenosine deaminase-related metal-dependent hydrolase
MRRLSGVSRTEDRWRKSDAPGAWATSWRHEIVLEEQRKSTPIQEHLAQTLGECLRHGLTNVRKGPQPALSALSTAAEASPEVSGEAMDLRELPIPKGFC